MPSPESGFHPESTETEPVALESDQAVSRERSALEKFRGKAGEVAKVLMMMSALSAGPGVVREAAAGEAKTAARTEQVQRKPEAINEANLTEASTWSRDMLAAAQQDSAKVRSSEDAKWLARSIVNDFIDEYFVPTVGPMEAGRYGLMKRLSTADDARFLLRNAEAMKALVTGLHGRYELPGYEGWMKQIDKMIERMTWEASYAGQVLKDSRGPVEQAPEMEHE